MRSPLDPSGVDSHSSHLSLKLPFCLWNVAHQCLRPQVSAYNSSICFCSLWVFFFYEFGWVFVFAFCFVLPLLHYFLAFPEPKSSRDEQMNIKPLPTRTLATHRSAIAPISNWLAGGINKQRCG